MTAWQLFRLLVLVVVKLVTYATGEHWILILILSDIATAIVSLILSPIVTLIVTVIVSHILSNIVSLILSNIVNLILDWRLDNWLILLRRRQSRSILLKESNLDGLVHICVWRREELLAGSSR